MPRPRGFKSGKQLRHSGCSKRRPLGASLSFCTSNTMVRNLEVDCSRDAGGSSKDTMLGRAGVSCSSCSCAGYDAGCCASETLQTQISSMVVHVSVSKPSLSQKQTTVVEFSVCMRFVGPSRPCLKMSRSWRSCHWMGTLEASISPLPGLASCSDDAWPSSSSVSPACHSNSDCIRALPHTSVICSRITGISGSRQMIKRKGSNARCRCHCRVCCNTAGRSNHVAEAAAVARKAAREIFFSRPRARTASSKKTVSIRPS
mmetsp:Transcript_32492/g.93531  ORF Transcript_32492/g.93531 Transcript_32492/m.93531 type:complete len:259 (+) Transcript_32492:2593-3369(+)